MNVVLTWLLLLPLVGGVLSWLTGRWPGLCRAIAFLSSALLFALGLWLWAAYRAGGLPGGDLLVQRAPWIPSLGVSYLLALDGLSLLLIVLTGLLGMVAVLASWREITTRVGAFHFTLLAVLTGVVGVFLARDLLLFYFFWELMLVPMYFLIALWGHGRPVYAAVKFFLFTFISSLFMLAAILALVFFHRSATGVLTFDSGLLLGTPLATRVARWLMLGFFLAFAVKLPAVPVHTWLADAHTEAPTGGSILLAGLLLKTGAYGMLRFALPLFPGASGWWTPVACWIGIAGILYGAFLAFGQRDFKRLVAFSSISHMGFVLLGIYAGTDLARLGAALGLFTHGLGTSALFFLSGSLQERTHTRDLRRLGGLWDTIPKFSGFTQFFALAALGLPGLGTFIAEFLVLLGAFQARPIWGIIAALGLVLSLVYALRLVQDSVHGPNDHTWSLPDLTAREVLSLAALALGLVWLGLYPTPLLSALAPPLSTLNSQLSTPARQ